MSNLELHLVKDNKEEVEFNILKRPIAEFPAECRVNASQDLDSCEKEEECKISTDSFVESKQQPSLGELKATGADDYDGGDGFTTPTSLEHKIPAIKQCPPAPRKARPLHPPVKRKASSLNARRSLLLDLSQEVKSLYPRPVHADLHQNIKKARTHDDKPVN